MNSIVDFLTRNGPKNSFLFVIFLASVLQAIFTSFNTYYPHEAYYWIWSKDLSWGYYDHPPLVALLIKLGYYILPNQLGIRLPFIILYIGFVEIIFRILNVKNYYVFYAIILTVSVVGLIGIFAIPDIPLIFFTALFFLVYKQFIEKQSYGNGICLGVVMALLLYSKYNGLLVILFVLLSNLRLLSSPKFYLACLVGLIAYLPHLYWQYENGFPSIMFHLWERDKFYTGEHYEIRYTLAYIGTQLLFYGPVSAILLFYYILRSQTYNLFYKSLKFCLYGILIFFLLYTYKSLILAQWTIMAVVPIILLAYKGAIYSKKFYRLLHILTIVSVIVSVIARISLAYAPYFNKQPSLLRDFIDLKTITNLSANMPDIFINDWKGHSLNEFYTGRQSYSINNLYDRKNEYNYLLSEEKFWGKKVMIFEPKGQENYLNSQPLGTTQKGKILYNYYIKNNFYSFSMIKLNPTRRFIKALPGKKVYLRLEVQNPYKLPIETHIAKNTEIVYTISDGPLICTSISLDAALNNLKLDVEFQAPNQTGRYIVKYGIMAPGMTPTHNSPVIILDVI
ncbi:MAG: ArnT family glycosyltransferase [Solitalea-like symbiont of Acarus siro]